MACLFLACVLRHVGSSWTDRSTEQYKVTQFNAQIGAVQKEIGQRRKNKVDDADLQVKKTDLQKQQKDQEAAAAEKQKGAFLSPSTLASFDMTESPKVQD